MKRAVFALFAAFLACGTGIGRAQDVSPPAQSPLQSPEMKAWSAEMIAKLMASRVFPRNADGTLAEGKVLVRATVSRSGRLLNAYVAQSSKSGVVDAAALLTMHRAAPFPPMPESVKGESFNMTIPIGFSTRKKFVPNRAVPNGSI